MGCCQGEYKPAYVRFKTKIIIHLSHTLDIFIFILAKSKLTKKDRYDHIMHLADIIDEHFDDLVEAITPGARLEQPKPLFPKLDEQIIAQETAKLGL